MRRRRGEELETAIRAAVLGLLAEHGPAGVTMEAVASAARTSKPVLYRRWADRASLLRGTLVARRVEASLLATLRSPIICASTRRGDGENWRNVVRLVVVFDRFEVKQCHWRATVWGKILEMFW